MWDLEAKYYRSLKGFDTFLLLLSVVLVAGLNIWQLTEPAGQNPVVDTVIRPVHVRRMPDEMQLGYDRWTKRTKDVSVFARGQTAYGWVVGYLDEDKAKADAMAWCMQNGKDCRVVEVRK